MSNVRKAAARTRRAAAPVEVESVHPAVLTAARKLAGGDTARLRIESATSVVVLNKARGGNK